MASARPRAPIFWYTCVMCRSTVFTLITRSSAISCVVRPWAIDPEPPLPVWSAHWDGPGNQSLRGDGRQGRVLLTGDRHRHVGDLIQGHPSTRRVFRLETIFAKTGASASTAGPSTVSTSGIGRILTASLSALSAPQSLAAYASAGQRRLPVLKLSHEIARQPAGVRPR